MVAAVDIFVVFATPALRQAYEEHLERRTALGSGRIEIIDLERPLPFGLDAVRVVAGSAPLGFVAESPDQALAAIRAGADEADVLGPPDLAELTHFLDRVRVRAEVRRERERLADDLRQAEGLTALGTLAAGVGHELNNPLAMITLGFDFLREALLPDLEVLWQARSKLERGALGPAEVERALRALLADSTDVAQILDDLSASTESVTQVVRDLRVFTRSTVAESPSFFQPGEVIQQALRLVRRQLPPRTVIEEDYEDDLPPLFLPRNRVAQVLTNLLVNAAQAMRELPRTTHRLRLGVRVDDQNIAFTIADTGPGIPDEDLERIFDPFFTTKRDGHGTGLGLSISRAIIHHLGGDLVVSSMLGDGATFIAFFPLPSAEELATAPSREAEPVTGLSAAPGRYTVLIVDDDERVLRATARALAPTYKVLTARDGAEAREVLLTGSHVHAVVSELSLVELDGVHFYEWLKNFQPELAGRLVFATGAHERAEYRTFLEESGVEVVPKPFAAADLLAAVARALASLVEQNASAPPSVRGRGVSYG